MANELRNTGISVVGDVPWGTHFCLLCETKQDFLDTLVPYFKAGLENNEFCMWVVSQPLTQQDATGALHQAMPDLDRYVAQRSIEIVSHDQWFLQQGVFDLHRVIKSWQEKLDQVLAGGYAGLRGIGDEGWLTEQYWNDFAQYEQELDKWMANKSMIVLCTYPLAAISGVQVFDVARNHRFVTARRQGNWQVLETPKLMQAKQEIQQLNEQLEQRVVERTGELAATNAALRREIAERQQAEEVLRKSEANFRTLADKSLQGILIYQDQKIVYANSAHSVTTGYSIAELKSMSLEQILSIVHTLDREMAFERARKRMAGDRSSASTELRIVRKDGVTRWIQTFNNGIKYYGRPAILSTTMDITERKRAEEALREGEEKFSAAFRASPVALVIATLDGKFVEMNQAYCDLLGYSREELIGKTGIELGVFTQEARQEWVGTAERNEGVITNRELSFRLQNGISRTVSSSVEKITFHGVPHFLSTILDITERKRAEDALRKSERVLREAESLGHTGSWEQDLVTGEIFNTEENLRLFFGDDRSKGADLEDYTQIVHPDDREYVLRRRAELLEEEGPGDIEYRVVWPDGSVHVIFGRATVVRDELGQPIRVYGTNVDITERKQAEEAFRLSEQRFQLLTETIPILVWSARADGVSDYYNAPFLQYLGRTLEEMQGWAWIETLHPDDRERSSVVWTQAISSGSDYETEYRIRRAADGQYRWHLGRAVPLRDSSGTIVRWYGTCTDIQDIADRAAMAIQNAQLFEQVQEAHERLQALSRQLLQAQEAERRSIARELHDEIGQQLTGLGLLLTSEHPSAEQLSDAHARVRDLIDRLRNLSLDLRPTILDDLGLLPALVWLFERYTAQTNVLVRFEHSGLEDQRFDPEVETSAYRIVQEALTNVARHAGVREVTVRLWTDDESLSLMIVDEGRGFDPQTIDARASSGLAGMRERAALLGGDMTIESADGEGTRLTVSLPLHGGTGLPEQERGP